MRITPVAAHAAERPAVHEVAPRRTPATPGDMRAAIARAHHRLTGRSASPGLLDTLVAHASLETASGAKMYNFNFGGIKGAGPGGATASCMTREVFGGKDVRLQQRFRAYASLDEGAMDYVQMMRGRFSGAIPHAERGDLEGFAHALKQARYYTASEAEYALALRNVSGKGESRAAPAEVLPSTTVELARILDVVAASSARILGSEEEA